MKKLLILLMVLVMTSGALAQLAQFRVAADDAKDTYYPSDIITIELVADFAVGSIGIDYVYGEPTASSPALNAGFTQLPLNPGVVKNAGGILLQSIAGGVASADILAGEVLHSFEYHVPEVQESTILVIDAGGVILASLDFSAFLEQIAPLEIHVTPEPMTVALLGLGGLFLRRRK